MKLLRSVTILLALAGWGQAATFYCDPDKGGADGDGSAERPWGTIEQVLAAKLIQLCDAEGKAANPNAPVRSGDTVLLRSGWHGAIRIARGFNTSFVTIAAAPGASARVGWVEIGEGSRWRIRGLTVSPSLAPAPPERVPRNLVSLGERGGEESHSLVVEDCFIYTSLDTAGWSAQDWIDKAASGIWLGRHGKGHAARNNFVMNVRFGINLCAPGCVAEGNVVSHFSADAIRATRDGQVVEYNVIKDILVGDSDGDKNHDDGIQVFLFNVGTGTVRDVVLRGNLIIAREDETVKFPATVQGIGCFDGPLVNFTVEKNVVCVNHYHGISLYDAQGCTIRDNVCFTRWGGKLRPWIMLGSKKKQAAGNTVRDNFAHSYSFTADRQVTAENNAEVNGQVFAARFNELADLIEQKYGRTHPVANLPRVKRD